MDPFPLRGSVLLTPMTTDSDVDVEGDRGGSKKWWDDGAKSVATHTDVRRLTDIGLTSDGTGSPLSFCFDLLLHFHKTSCFAVLCLTLI